MHVPADCVPRYADYAGSTINDGFDYTHGKDLWKEKLDYTRSWLSAHISDANAIGKPLIVEEFGKAVSAKKVYTGELPHSLMPGERRAALAPISPLQRAASTPVRAAGFAEPRLVMAYSSCKSTMLHVKRGPQ